MSCFMTLFLQYQLKQILTKKFFCRVVSESKQNYVNPYFTCKGHCHLSIARNRIFLTFIGLVDIEGECVTIPGT